MDHNANTALARLAMRNLDAAPLDDLTAELLDEYGRENWRRGDRGLGPLPFDAWLRERSQQPPRVFAVISR